MEYDKWKINTESSMFMRNAELLKNWQVTKIQVYYMKLHYQWTPELFLNTLTRL
jgi:hypothetical protein